MTDTVEGFVKWAVQVYDCGTFRGLLDYSGTLADHVAQALESASAETRTRLAEHEQVIVDYISQPRVVRPVQQGPIEVDIRAMAVSMPGHLVILFTFWLLPLFPRMELAQKLQHSLVAWSLFMDNQWLNAVGRLVVERSWFERERALVNARVKEIQLAEFPRAILLYNALDCASSNPLDLKNWAHFERVVHKRCLCIQPSYVSNVIPDTFLARAYPYTLIEWVYSNRDIAARTRPTTECGCAWMHRMICATGILTTLHERAKYALNCAHQPWEHLLTQ